jgi:hypothetical protein
MIHVLALLAKAGSGKTTIANWLKETYDARVVSLATPLKRCAQKVMGFSDQQLWGPQEEKEREVCWDVLGQGMSARRFLQLLGTEGLREEFGPNIHLDALSRQIDRMDSESEDHHVFVVDDVRFPNEVDYVVQSEDFIGACVKLVCTDLPANDNGSHVSETGVDGVPEEQVAATVTSSRLLGTTDLVRKFEHALEATPRLRSFKRVLDDGRRRMEGGHGSVRSASAGGRDS